MWPLAIVQTCIIHLIRNTFRLASKRDWDALKRDVKPDLHRGERRRGPGRAGRAHRELGQRYGAIIRLWENAWEEFIPFLDYDVEIRTVHLLHQRDRVAERPVPAGGQGPGPFPDRAGGAKVPLPGHPVPGPDRDRQDPVGRCGGSQRSTLSPSPSPTGSRPPRPTNPTAGNTVSEIDPR